MGTDRRRRQAGPSAASTKRAIGTRERISGRPAGRAPWRARPLHSPLHYGLPPMRLVALIAAAACSCCPPSRNAQWKWRDKDGRVQYSDLPPPRGHARRRHPSARPRRCARAQPPPSAPQPASAASATVGARRQRRAGVDPELEAKRKKAEPTSRPRSARPRKTRSPRERRELRPRARANMRHARKRHPHRARQRQGRARVSSTTSSAPSRRSAAPARWRPNDLPLSLVVSVRRPGAGRRRAGSAGAAPPSGRRSAAGRSRPGRRRASSVIERRAAAPDADGESAPAPAHAGPSSPLRAQCVGHRRAARQLQFDDDSTHVGPRAAGHVDAQQRAPQRLPYTCSARLTKESTNVSAIRSNTGLIDRLERRVREGVAQVELDLAGASLGRLGAHRQEPPRAVEQRERPVDQLHLHRPAGHVVVARGERLAQAASRPGAAAPSCRRRLRASTSACVAPRQELRVVARPSTTSSYISCGAYQSRTDFLTCFIESRKL